MPAKIKTTIKRQRTRSSSTAIAPQSIVEPDSRYFLKLVLFVLLGTVWLKFNTPLMWHSVQVSGIPLGLGVGLPVIHQYEKLQADRKIWYAVLVVVTIICYFVPAGIVI